MYRYYFPSLKEKMYDEEIIVNLNYVLFNKSHPEHSITNFKAGFIYKLNRLLGDEM